MIFFFIYCLGPHTSNWLCDDVAERQFKLFTSLIWSASDL